MIKTKVACQRRRYAMPHDVGLGMAVQQEERASLAARAHKDAPRRRVYPMRGKAGKEVCEVRHHGRQRLLRKAVLVITFHSF